MRIFTNGTVFTTLFLEQKDESSNVTDGSRMSYWEGEGMKIGRLWELKRERGNLWIERSGKDWKQT